MMTKTRLLLFAAMLIAVCLSAQKSNQNKPLFLPLETTLKSPVKYQTDSLTAALDAAFDAISALTPIKGFNAALRLPDGSVWKRSSGLAAEQPTPQVLTTEHLMGMGSITKTFVATTLLLLIEEGMCALDDSIGQYIPAFPNISGKITIRQILNHRSGLNDYATENPATFEYWQAHPAYLFSRDEILNNYVLTPNFAPDSSWSYSNTNYLIASLLIENVTGEPWYTVVRQRILEPNNLTHTFAYPWETPGNNPVAHAFSDIDGDGIMNDMQGTGFPVDGLFSMAGSSGCLLSTPEDLVIFMEKLLEGGILQPTSLEAMKVDYEQDGSGFTYGLGLGSFPLPQPIENWGHTGGIIYQAVSLYFPSEKIALAVQQNDERGYSPTDSIPTLDLYVLFVTLLDTYINYLPPSSTVIPATGLVSLSPNPTNGSFRLEFRHDNMPLFPLTVRIMDSNGRIVALQNIENEGDNISLHHLPSGIYTVQAGRYLGKIAKQ